MAISSGRISNSWFAFAAAHVIEEIYTPLNFAGMTFTTGTTAFQTPVGITWTELSGREAAGAGRAANGTRGGPAPADGAENLGGAEGGSVRPFAWGQPALTS